MPPDIAKHALGAGGKSPWPSNMVVHYRLVSFKNTKTLAGVVMHDSGPSYMGD